MFVIRQPNTIIRYTLFNTSSYFCPSWFACGGLMKPISPCIYTYQFVKRHMSTFTFWGQEHTFTTLNDSGVQKLCNEGDYDWEISLPQSHGWESHCWGGGGALGWRNLMCYHPPLHSSRLLLCWPHMHLPSTVPCWIILQRLLPNHVMIKPHQSIPLDSRHREKRFIRAQLRLDEVT